VIWIWILIMVIIDIFRNPDTSGWAKALWFLFVLFVPLIGVLVYLIVEGASRSVWRLGAAIGSYGRQAVPGHPAAPI
jgi:hypothetical protein